MKSFSELFYTQPCFKYKPIIYTKPKIARCVFKNLSLRSNYECIEEHGLLGKQCNWLSVWPGPNEGHVQHVMLFRNIIELQEKQQMYI